MPRHEPKVIADPRERREEARAELARRLTLPQRHRLLQGYPMAPLMQPLHEDFASSQDEFLETERPLILGVLPHAACNPKVRGCGFCTFPHERFENAQVRRVVTGVAAEVRRTVERWPALRSRRVGGLYFGGGTANLTPPADFRVLARTLEETFDLRDSEVTLEGVPRYFLLHDGALLDVLSGMGVRHRRLSLGVQTFDPEWLVRMGREAFGDAEQIHRVVEAAHARGFTVSADLLFNLPGRSRAQTLEDVRRADAMGFDQICVYNLVLTAEMGTAWAEDPALVGAMPGAEEACALWLDVRQTLLDAGFVQTSLTNFERREVADSPRRFFYELAGFEPGTWDMLGFGPAAISTLIEPGIYALKWMNKATGADYLKAQEGGGSPADRCFQYAPDDLSLLFLTRHLARMRIDLATYDDLVCLPANDLFPLEFELLEEAGLLHRPEPQVLVPTPRGMFFADTIAGLLSWKRVQWIRGRLERGQEYFDYMG